MGYTGSCEREEGYTDSQDCLAAYQEAFKRLPGDIREAEVNAETHDIMDISVENGKISGLQSSSNTVLFIRVNGERTGYMYTEDLKEDPMQILHRALENSGCSDRKQPDLLNGEPLVLKQDAGKAVQDPAELERVAAKMERAILEGGCGVIRKVHVSLKAETVALRTVNSHGRDVSFCSPLYLLRVTVNGTDGEKNYSSSYQTTASKLHGFREQEYLESLETGLMSQMKPEPSFSSGEYPVVLDRVVVRNLFVTAWQLFSGLKYMEGSSVFCGLLGTRVGGDALNITDYPSHPSSGFCVPFDCEGTAGKQVKLMEGGVLCGLLTNLGSAASLGLVPTGNAGRKPLLFGNIATDILVTPRNLVIEPGSSDITQLLEHMGDGIYITVSFDVFHTVNISSGEFCVPCKGIRIRNGKMAEHLSSLQISGNLRDLFSHVAEVGRQMYLSPMEDLENYGIGACDLRLTSCRVSGE